MNALTETPAVASIVPMRQLSRNGVGCVMHGDVMPRVRLIVGQTAGWIEADGRRASLWRRDAAALLCLARCRPGMVTDRMMLAFADPRHSTHGAGALHLRMWRLRKAFAEIGLPYHAIRRCSGLGWQLAALVEIVE